MNIVIFLRFAEIFKSPSMNYLFTIKGDKAFQLFRMLELEIFMVILRELIVLFKKVLRTGKNQRT